VPVGRISNSKTAVYDGCASLKDFPNRGGSAECVDAVNCSSIFAVHRGLPGAGTAVEIIRITIPHKAGREPVCGSLHVSSTAVRYAPARNAFAGAGC